MKYLETFEKMINSNDPSDWELFLGVLASADPLDMKEIESLWKVINESSNRDNIYSLIVQNYYEPAQSRK